MMLRRARLAVRSEAKSLPVSQADTSDWSVRVDGRWWYWIDCLEVLS